jgi:two-component system, NtrC family, sensor kinase
LTSAIRRSLGLRLSLLLGCILSLSVGAVIYLLTLSHRNQIEDETAVGAERLAETIKRSINQDMLEKKRDRIQRSLEEIGRQNGVAYVRIYSKGGVVAYSSQAGEIGRRVNKTADACDRCHKTANPTARLDTLRLRERLRITRGADGHRVLGTIQGISNDVQCWSAPCHAHPREQQVLGVIALAFSLQEADVRRARMTRVAALAMAVAIVCVCSVIGLAVHRFIARPAKLLLKATTLIASGQLQHRIPIAGTDEMGELAKAFNTMTEKLLFYIHALTETQEKLFHAQRLAALGKMAAGIAHEINSPLTIILNDASLLLRDAAEGSREEGDLRVIVAEAKRCGQVVHNLLEFARADKPRRRTADLNEIVRETLLLASHQAIIQDVTVHVNLRAEWPKVRVDVDQLKQVFLDIISNAVQAMPGGGSLTIESDDPPGRDFVRVSFADTGCGIPEENIEKIFQPFFTTKDATRGTGLGLAICDEIVRKHGGRIGVKSVVGRGTCVTVELPRASRA